VRRVSAIAVLAVALAGCGGGGDSNPPPSTSQSSPGPVPRPQQPNADPEPFGALSAAEYRAIVREYRELRPLAQGQTGADALDLGRRACARLREPNTQLVERVQTDCDNAISFFAALAGLEQAGSDCSVISENERLTCLRDRYTGMADAIRATRNGAAAINRELSRRGITGLCARSIGITPSQLDAYRRAEQAAREGVDAIAVADSQALDRATQDLENALTAGSSNDPLSGIERGCRKAPPQRLPRVPDQGGVQA
jgi:hypothetical protein